MHRGKSLRLRRAGLICWMLTVPSVVLACPMCKSAIEGDPVASAFNWTTLFMIAVPASLFGSIGGWVFYCYWRAARRQAAVPSHPLA